MDLAQYLNQNVNMKILIREIGCMLEGSITCRLLAVDKQRVTVEKNDSVFNMPLEGIQSVLAVPSDFSGVHSKPALKPLGGMLLLRRMDLDHGFFFTANDIEAIEAALHDLSDPGNWYMVVEFDHKCWPYNYIQTAIDKNGTYRIELNVNVDGIPSQYAYNTVYYDEMIGIYRSLLCNQSIPDIGWQGTPSHKYPENEPEAKADVPDSPRTDPTDAAEETARYYWLADKHLLAKNIGGLVYLYSREEGWFPDVQHILGSQLVMESRMSDWHTSMLRADVITQEQAQKILSRINSGEMTSF